MFSFFGAFTDENTVLAEHFRQHWPDADVAYLEKPFRGLAVRFPETEYRAEEEDVPEAVTASVLSISGELPVARIVLLRAECWGGICSFFGRFIREGKIQLDERGGSGEKGDEALRRLIGVFDVDMGPSANFEPLARNFPWKRPKK